VIFAASVFLEQELFPRRQSPVLARDLFDGPVCGCCRALFFERLAYLIKTKNAIVLSLVIWSGIVFYAYRFLHTVTEAWILAAMIAIVLGGSQALSRSLFSRMIPDGKEAAFFGLYEVSERGTSWMGPLLFSIVVASTVHIDKRCCH
jgi:UMF1 family MFS transporter